MFLAGDPHVTFLGHATIVLDMDGVRLLSDPILRNRVGLLVRLRTPIEEMHWNGVDVELIWHSHWDHLDYGSLRLLGSDRPIIVPRIIGAALLAPMTLHSLRGRSLVRHRQRWVGVVRERPPCVAG